MGLTETVELHRDELLEPGAGRRAVRGVRLERAGEPPLWLPLYPDRSYLFGRDPTNTVVFASDNVSRQHASLVWLDDGQLAVRDLNSRNGTWALDREPAEGEDPRRASRRLQAEPRIVRDGTVVLLGDGTNRLVFTADAPAPAPTRGPCSRAMQQLEEDLRIAARHRRPVFLQGPSGSGKTHSARRIHELSRLGGQFVLVNCGALPADATALASYFVGHQKGAFTGAVAERQGQLYLADGGTLFLDEVESMPAGAQDFLLDVLDGSGPLLPLGASVTRRERPRFRLVVASHTPLLQSRLRPDLVQRLAEGTFLQLPTLAERPEDIPDLVQGFLAEFSASQGVEAELSAEALALLQAQPWPGQVRELRATVQTVVDDERARREEPPPAGWRLRITAEAVQRYLERRRRGLGAPAGPVPLAQHAVPPTQVLPVRRAGALSAEELRAALAAHEGNKTRAAKALGIALNTLKAHLRRHGLG